MAVKVRPLHDRIIVERLEETEHVVGSIIIPDTAKEKPQQGKIIAAASTVEKDTRSELKSGSNKKAAGRIGKTIAERTLAAGVTAVVFDRGAYRYHGRVKALADAAREGGLNF